MTTPSATESTLVDIDQLEALAKAAVDAEVETVSDEAAALQDFRHQFTPSVVLALLREVRAHRSAGEPEPEWEPLHDGDGMLRVDEGNTYLFAIETNQGWEYFQDAIVWDSESDPRWYDGDAGWEIDDVTHFRALPAPPQSEPAATTEGT